MTNDKFAAVLAVGGIATLINTANPDTISVAGAGIALLGAAGYVFAKDRQ